MNVLLRLADNLVQKAVGSVDAGACVDVRGCCCTPGVPGVAFDCFGHCVNATCSDVRSAYGTPCD